MLLKACRIVDPFFLSEVRVFDGEQLPAATVKKV
jgi:hypothetical protein